MSKLVLLYLTLLVGLFFLIAPEPIEAYDFFPFSDMKLYPSTYIYFICERAVLVILSWIIYNESTEYSDALFIFFLLMCADVVDFLLCYNSIWFRIGDLPISMNIMKSIIFGIVILQTWIKNSFK